MRRLRDCRLPLHSTRLLPATAMVSAPVSALPDSISLHSRTCCPCRSACAKRAWARRGTLPHLSHSTDSECCSCGASHSARHRRQTCLALSLQEGAQRRGRKKSEAWRYALPLLLSCGLRLRMRTSAFVRGGPGTESEGHRAARSLWQRVAWRPCIKLKESRAVFACSSKTGAPNRWSAVGCQPTVSAVGCPPPLGGGATARRGAPLVLSLCMHPLHRRNLTWWKRGSAPAQQNCELHCRLQRRRREGLMKHDRSSGAAEGDGLLARPLLHPAAAAPAAAGNAAGWRARDGAAPVQLYLFILMYSYPAQEAVNWLPAPARKSGPAQSAPQPGWARPITSPQRP